MFIYDNNDNYRRKRMVQPPGCVPDGTGWWQQEPYREDPKLDRHAASTGGLHHNTADAYTPRAHRPRAAGSRRVLASIHTLAHDAHTGMAYVYAGHSTPGVDRGMGL